MQHHWCVLYERYAAAQYESLQRFDDKGAELGWVVLSFSFFGNTLVSQPTSTSRFAVDPGLAVVETLTLEESRITPSLN